jgi:hypothetical protein
MVLPQKVKDLFHRGEVLAAEVTAERAGWRAWICVKPIMNAGRTYAQAIEEWTRTGVAEVAYDDTISHFIVRHVELSEWHLDDRWYFDLDLAIKERPIVDEWTTAADDTALEHLLKRWLPYADVLQAPRSVDYPDPPIVSAA